MKRFLLLAAVAAVAIPAFVAEAGVSVQMGQPGFYGTIDIGGFAQPQLIYPEPVIIQRVPVDVMREPIYLHVPPGHAKNWSKHCGKYNACGRPVYFVQNGWYDREYVPRYQELHDEGHGSHHGDDGDDGNHKGHGNGKGHGHGNGKGHND